MWLVCKNDLEFLAVSCPSTQVEVAVQAYLMWIYRLGASRPLSRSQSSVYLGGSVAVETTGHTQPAICERPMSDAHCPDETRLIKIKTSVYSALDCCPCFVFRLFILVTKCSSSSKLQCSYSLRKVLS